MVGLSPVMSTIVDSMPMPTGPPSRTISILPFISSITCAAVVGEGLPDRLALGAAINTPESFISFKAPGWDGIRIATVLSPPVVVSGTTDLFLNIMVRGPGQKASINSFAPSGTYSASS